MANQEAPGSPGESPRHGESPLDGSTSGSLSIDSSPTGYVHADTHPHSNVYMLYMCIMNSVLIYIYKYRQN